MKFKLGIQTEHEDPHQQQAPWPLRSKVKVANSRDASDRCRSISRERNVLEILKLIGWLSTPRAIMRTSFKVKGKGQGHWADIMLRPEVRHIFRRGRPTNFKQLVYRWRTKTRTITSNLKGQGCDVTWCVWQVLADRLSRERKVPETLKLISRLLFHKQ